MKKTFGLCMALVLLLALILPLVSLAASPVPDTLPEDLGGKTLYGYLMDLKKDFMPAKVFQDAVKYTDENRENARRAISLMIAATSQKMASSGAEDQYNLYLRAYAYDLLFGDTGDPGAQRSGLDDYKKTVAAGGAYAQADYDRLAAMEVKAAPLSWQMAQMLTLEDIGSILRISAGDLILLSSNYQQGDGSRLGAGYTLRSIVNPAEAAVYVLADLQGGKARYDLLKGFAFLGNLKEIEGLGDEAVLLGLRNMDNDPRLYTTVLYRKGDLVLQVRIPDAVWRGTGFNMDPEKLAEDIAAKVLSNLYDAGRPISSLDGVNIDTLPPLYVFKAGTADSPVPETLPSDLGGKTEYGYLVGIRQQYLPANVFTDGKRTDAERNNARRALRLIAESLSRRFDAYGQNPYELEIRGACYAAAFADTGDEGYRKLAINDYKQAMSTGFTLPKADYDRLATPLLSPMAEMPAKTSGGNAMFLQEWLNEAGYSVPLTFILDDVMVQAVKAYEKDNGLTEDGIVDIGFLLSLYSKVDGGDRVLVGK